MNKEDIIRTAREAGLFQHVPPTSHVSFIYDLMEFTALVAAEVSKCEGCGKPHALYCLKCCEESIVQTAVKEEREACAQVVDDFGEWMCDKYVVAKIIRARGEK